MGRRCAQILCNAPKEKKTLATERTAKPKSHAVGPNKRHALLGLVASSGSSGHIWKVTTDKFNLCVKCERCSLWIQQTDKKDLFERLVQVPCLDHNMLPPLQAHASHKMQFLGSLWKCKSCDAQLSVRKPKLSQKLKLGCKSKSKKTKEEPQSKQVSLFFQTGCRLRSCFNQGSNQSKAKTKRSGADQVKL